jgi:Fe-S cluster assembly iron-binding protein IscA
VGQSLPQGKIEMSVEANGTRLFGSTVIIKDRKVEAKESITTSAGTFECFKVSSVVETKSIMSMESKTIQWIAEGIGIVKTENLSKNGKLIGSQVLTGIKK